MKIFWETFLHTKIYDKLISHVNENHENDFLNRFCPYVRNMSTYHAICWPWSGMDSPSQWFYCWQLLYIRGWTNGACAIPYQGCSNLDLGDKFAMQSLKTKAKKKLKFRYLRTYLRTYKMKLFQLLSNFIKRIYQRYIEIYGKSSRRTVAFHSQFLNSNY